jgi:hypothetical protein
MKHRTQGGQTITIAKAPLTDGIEVRGLSAKKVGSRSMDLFEGGIVFNIRSSEGYVVKIEL